jgi:hypothetical protein
VSVDPDDPDYKRRLLIYINGRLLDELYDTMVYSSSSPQVKWGLIDENRAPYEYAYPQTPLMLGPRPRTYVSPFVEYDEYLDSTVDEFYLWQESAEFYTQIRDEFIKQGLWGRGRYYRGSDAIFTSGKVEFEKLFREKRGSADQPYLLELSPMILGISWTAYDEDIYDWQVVGQISGQDPQRLVAHTLIYLEEFDGSSYRPINEELPFKKNWWSWVGKRLEPPYTIRYKLKFEMPYIDTLNSVLLESPIFDDISIYYKSRPQFLSWVLV